MRTGAGSGPAGRGAGYYRARLRNRQDRRIPLKPTRRRSDDGYAMLIHPGPMSNTERQRRFRERHPGYYGRLRRRRKLAMPLVEAAVAPTPAAIATATSLANLPPMPSAPEPLSGMAFAHRAEAA
jgi:hypothetical protein